MEPKLIEIVFTESEFVFITNAVFNSTISGKDARLVAELQTKLIERAKEADTGSPKE